MILPGSYFLGWHLTIQVVHEEFGIVEGLMTTVHATTGRIPILLDTTIIFLLSTFCGNLNLDSVFLSSNTENGGWTIHEGLERWPWCQSEHHSQLYWGC
jgi:hypothetical protein